MTVPVTGCGPTGAVAVLGAGLSFLLRDRFDSFNGSTA